MHMISDISRHSPDIPRYSPHNLKRFPDNSRQTYFPVYPLKMESAKIVPDSLSKNNVGNDNLPESVDPDTNNSGIEK